MMSIGVSVILAAILAQTGASRVRSLDQGSQSAVADARQVTARDGEEWAMLWRAHAPSRPQPSVDFSSEMVVGVFAGTRPTAGFAIEIVSYREQGETLVVTFRETVPPRGAIIAQMLTSPYHLVAIPKRGGTVTFETVKN